MQLVGQRRYLAQYQQGGGNYGFGTRPFRHFIQPPGDHALFRSLVRLFVTDHLDAEMELLLEGDEVPPLKLDPGEPCLGWNTWLRGETSPDVSTVFSMREN